jgi:hypothetical protein
MRSACSLPHPQGDVRGRCGRREGQVVHARRAEPRSSSRSERCRSPHAVNGDSRTCCFQGGRHVGTRARTSPSGGCWHAPHVVVRTFQTRRIPSALHPGPAGSRSITDGRLAHGPHASGSWPLRQEPGGLRVPHPNGDEERGQQEAGDRVAHQLFASVRAQCRHPRHEPDDRRRHRFGSNRPQVNAAARLPAPSSSTSLYSHFERAHRIGESWGNPRRGRSPSSSSTARRIGRSTTGHSEDTAFGPTTNPERYET